MAQKIGVYQHTDGTGIPALLRITYEPYTAPNGRVGDCYAVRMEKCGMDFGVVVRLVEPLGPAPCLEVARPLGLTLVEKLIDHFAGRTALASTN